MVLKKRFYLLPIQNTHLIIGIVEANKRIQFTLADLERHLIVLIDLSDLVLDVSQLEGYEFPGKVDADPDNISF